VPFLPPHLQEYSVSTFTPEMILEAARLFHWAEMFDFAEYLTGKRERVRTIENALPILVKKGQLKCLKHKNKYVYAVTPDKTRHKGNIAHGLSCTEALLRHKATSNAEFVPESYFRMNGFKVVPEWAAILSQTITSFEYSTEDNFRRQKEMNKKLVGYKKSLHFFAEHFEREPIVLFVFDAPEYAIVNFLKRKSGLKSFYFTDHKSFFDVDKTNQRTAPIYIWGGDLKKYPLVES